MYVIFYFDWRTITFAAFLETEAAEMQAAPTGTLPVAEKTAIGHIGL